MKQTTTLLAVSVFLVVLSTGCLTQRERMQELRKPQNNVFQTKGDVGNLNLVEEKPGALALWNQTRTQSIHILQLRPEATLSKRFHRNHDLTLQ